MRLLQYILLLGLLAIAWPSPSHSQTPSPQKPLDINGNWEGTLSVGPTKLRLILKVETIAGSMRAKMDSVDQPNANNLKVDVISTRENAVHFEMVDLSVEFDGVLSQDGTEIAGTFKQAGNALPLILKKAGVTKSKAAVQRGRMQLTPCDNPSLTGDALCGKYEVFEDRALRSGRKIALNLILLPATGKPAADPLFYLAGGPGAGATTYAAESFIQQLRRDRDVVLVDQRGTGNSNPLNCELGGSREDMRGFFSEVFPPEKVKQCRSELEKIANLKLYTTSIAMDDLDEVRAALGYDRINLYGGSYGSTAALVFLRQHPEKVRSVAVFGVAPPDAKLPLSFARGVQDAINRLFVDCAADETCRTAYPNVAEEFRTVITRFDKGPVEIAVPNVFSGQSQQVLVTRDAFVDAIRQLLYVPNAAAALPALIHLGAKGNLGPLMGTAFQVVSQIDSKIARGLQFSVICSEDTPFITVDEIKRTSENSFYGDARVRPTMRACEEWPRASVPPSFLDAVKADAPVLMISGQLAPVTPPWLSEAAARALPHSKLVQIQNGTHASYECVEELVARFIDKGTLDGLDTSCVAQIKRPPFTVLKEQ